MEFLLLSCLLCNLVCNPYNGVGAIWNFPENSGSDVKILPGPWNVFLSHAISIVTSEMRSMR